MIRIYLSGSPFVEIDEPNENEIIREVRDCIAKEVVFFYYKGEELSVYINTKLITKIEKTSE